MISVALRTEIDRYAAHLNRSRILHKARTGEVSKATVGRYLTSVHYLLRHTPIHLARGKQRALTLGHARLAAYFEQKLAEEVGHERWAKDDIAELTRIAGRPVADDVPDAIVALMDSVGQAIEREPFSYLAYILFAEYLTVRLGPQWVAALDSRCGVPASALTVATHHIELDQHHVQEGCEEIDLLVQDERLHESLRAMLRDSMAHFSAFCEDLADFAA